MAAKPEVTIGASELFVDLDPRMPGRVVRIMYPAAPDAKGRDRYHVRNIDTGRTTIIGAHVLRKRFVKKE